MSRWRCPDCGTTKSAVPRFTTLPTKGARTWQQDVRRSLRVLGTPAMPWQRDGIRLVTELRPGGLPRFPLVVISVPRQMGKTVLSRGVITARSQHGALLEVYGTALTRDSAAKHVMKLGDALQFSAGWVQDEPDLLMYLPSKVLRGRGQESVLWPNGTVYRPIAPNESGGHGDSIDFFLGDEAWGLTSEVLVGVAPAMLARPMSQTLLISTMGTVDSDIWNGFVRDGRESVHDPNARMAYIEYSAERDEDVFDESKWHGWMPALGRTVSHEGVRILIDTLLKDPDEGPAGVVRSVGNRVVSSLVTIFPADWVEAALARVAQPQRFVVAVDVNNDPVGATVTTGHLTDKGKVATRVVEWRAGSPFWVTGFVREMLSNPGREVEAVVGDFGGPARPLHAELEVICDQASVPLVDRLPRDLAADTDGFYDALRERRVVMDHGEPLEEAIAGARKKALGDMWLVARRLMTVDASPLITTILAYGMATELSVTPVVKPFFLPWPEGYKTRA